MADLSGLTVDQLTTMQTNLVAAHAKALASYSIDGLSVTRNAESILRQLEDVNAALAGKATPVGDVGDVVLLDFDDFPGDRY